MKTPLRRHFPVFLAIVLLAAACGRSSPVALDMFRTQLEEARKKGASFCAPADFAAAEAYLDFAAKSYELGNRQDGENYLRKVPAYLNAATKKSQNCASDLDNDGIPDWRDGDPYRAEDYDGFQDEDGIPEDDNDGDGYLDGEDSCPNEPEDFDGFEDEDGCPDNDNDYDGVPDDRDLCPTQPEDIDGWQDEDGCPDPDNDNDGFPDLADACPDNPETFNGFLDDDGCPDQLPKKRKFIALPEVEFLGHSAYLTKKSKANLVDFAQKLQRNPDLHVRIESHLYGRGDEEAARELTRKRAEALKAYLVENGVLAQRLTALAFGGDRPIADNDTYAGRLKNERVDFIIYLP
ncbi:MAG: OmpA family protein [Myxococcales bacterium]|nr:OmpA family protein [Myxococcales bacterium]